jgi:hypothetical protein
MWSRNFYTGYNETHIKEKDTIMLNSLKAKIAKNKNAIIDTAFYAGAAALVAGAVYASYKLAEAESAAVKEYVDNINEGLSDGTLAAYADATGVIHIIPNIFDNASN